MKTRLAILIALACAGTSFGAYALDGDVPAPSVNLPNTAPKLYPSEQGAFKALEVATQLVESNIVQKGCKAGTVPFEVHTTYDGSGTAAFGWPARQVNLTIALGGVSPNDGRWYTVTGGGSFGQMLITDIKAQGSFNIGSSIQELSTSWKATSFVTNLPNLFTGTVIKDYVRLSNLKPIPTGFDDAGTLVSMVVDYGYQQVTKENYAKAKYWQQSHTWRDDGVNAGTYWLKTRVAPLSLSQPCTIEVKLAGYGEAPADNIEGFNEKGTLTVKTVEIGPYLNAVNSK